MCKIAQFIFYTQSEFKDLIQIELAIVSNPIISLKKEFDFSPIFKGYIEMRVIDTIGENHSYFEFFSERRL